MSFGLVLRILSQNDNYRCVMVILHPNDKFLSGMLHSLSRDGKYI